MPIVFLAEEPSPIPLSSPRTDVVSRFQMQRKILSVVLGEGGMVRVGVWALNPVCKNSNHLLCIVPFSLPAKAPRLQRITILIALGRGEVEWMCVRIVEEKTGLQSGIRFPPELRSPSPPSLQLNARKSPVNAAPKNVTHDGTRTQQNVSL